MANLEDQILSEYQPVSDISKQVPQWLQEAIWEVTGINYPERINTLQQLDLGCFAENQLQPNLFAHGILIVKESKIPDIQHARNVALPNGARFTLPAQVATWEGLSAGHELYKYLFSFVEVRDWPGEQYPVMSSLSILGVDARMYPILNDSGRCMKLFQQGLILGDHGPTSHNLFPLFLFYNPYFRDNFFNKISYSLPEDYRNFNFMNSSSIELLSIALHKIFWREAVYQNPKRLEEAQQLVCDFTDQLERLSSGYDYAKTFFETIFFRFINKLLTRDEYLAARKMKGPLEVHTYNEIIHSNLRFAFDFVAASPIGILSEFSRLLQNYA